MSAEVQTAASDAPSETETSTEVAEQTTESKIDYASELLRLAADDGHTVVDNPPPEDESETESVAEETVPETETEPEAEEKEAEVEEETSVAEKKNEWPDSAKARVAEETAKRRRANERADKAELEATSLKQQLAQASAPAPTEDDPFRDIRDAVQLDELEKSYEKAIDLADQNPDGAVDVFLGRDKDGREIRQDLTPNQLAIAKRTAEKAIRKFIPERRTYLQQKAAWDSELKKVYPELQDADSDFAKATSFLENRLMNGEAMKSPDARVWIARAVRGYQMELQRNGNGAKPSTDADKIIKSSKQKIAPTPVKTRSFVERARRPDLTKAEQEFKASGDAESAERLVGALLSQTRSGVKKLERIAE